MASTGRKVGTCDAAQQRQAREAQIADAKKQVAQSETMIKQQNDEQIRQGLNLFDQASDLLARRRQLGKPEDEAVAVKGTPDKPKG